MFYSKRWRSFEWEPALHPIPSHSSSRMRGFFFYNIRLPRSQEGDCFSLGWAVGLLCRPPYHIGRLCDGFTIKSLCSPRIRSWIQDWVHGSFLWVKWNRWMCSETPHTFTPRRYVLWYYYKSPTLRPLMLGSTKNNNEFDWFPWFLLTQSLGSNPG